MGLKILSASNAYIVTENNPLERTYIKDFISYYAANILVDNTNFSGIEIVNGFLKAITLDDIIVAVTGNVEFKIDNKKAPLWQAIYVPKDSEIEVKSSKESLGYLVVRGLSTKGFIRKKIDNNETLNIKEKFNDDFIKELPARRIPEYLLKEYFDNTLRIISHHSNNNKLNMAFKVERKSVDEGILLRVLDGIDGVCKVLYERALKFNNALPGSCIYLNNENLFITLNHTQVNGNVIARIHPCDMDKLVNIHVGDVVRIVSVDLKEYNEIFKHYNNFLSRIRRCIKASVEALKRGAKLVKVKLGNKVYELWVEEIQS